ncbi:metallophosphoesterase [Bacillus sp. DTU_2020_1000418_1_SI_GHA_SEK_038]|uniref:metallophosphoesterase n=1 Tax=Bacillus sp. DTU_2020_1000418_1_SI_GHA_SEK_038 TaxID=3077585 RepID=UPI0028E7103F|nr:metallophosphoesterase [Bacillus sp. DTU_2020_1000418_1_SI_GHA_SEK_038]WNS73547.1 metallophosphoesterase [Bacillus sp. DTU_2020_1000418_1_SI_GHA_SEK_038]
MKRIKVIIPVILIISLLLIVLNRTDAKEIMESSLRLRILETTDLHSHMLGFNYKKNKPNLEFGLAKTASLIKQAREEEINSLLFDVGDVLVGSALDEYVDKTNYMDDHYFHPVFKAMNGLNYDAATVGNHEFNHGLDFLHKSLQGAKFPYVNANIYIDDQNQYDGDDLNYFNPFLILDRNFIDTNGNKQKLKVGVIGFLTPIAAEWDKKYFQGKLKIKNIQDTAEHFVPIMKKMGADIIIALAHVGLNPDKGLKEKEGNSVYFLSEVEGIDAILYGHTHLIFPWKNLYSVKDETGTINGVPAVQAGYWGNHLGIIDLELTKMNGNWLVNSSQSMVKPVFQTIKGKSLPLVNEDDKIVKVLEYIHLEIQKFFETSK